MKNCKLLMLVFVFLGCAAVPKQIVDAMKKQDEEIQRVKRIYFENMNNQLDALEKYRLGILEICEEQYKNKIRKAPGTKVDNEGNVSETLISPTGDPEVDVFNVKLLEKVETFFKAERDSVRIDMQNRRDEVIKAEANFENIELINTIVNDYLESLAHLRESRNRFTRSIRDKLREITPIPVNLNRIPDPYAVKDLLNKFKIK